MSTPRRTALDTSALTAPIDRSDFRRFLDTIKKQGRRVTIDRIVVVLLSAAMAVLVAVVGYQLVRTVIRAFTRGNPQASSFLAPIVFLAIIAVVVLLFIRQYRKTRITAYRLAQFAVANGMSWQGQIAAPARPGMIFHQGRGQTAHNVIRGDEPRTVEFANFEYTTGSGKSKQTHHWGYVAIRLDVPLPNIVLDALGNNTLGTNLPERFRSSQRLSLEGDFDRHFRLYCPDGYERDALYLFTPDIMARFVDNAAQLDVEIVDDWMFLYTQRKIVTTDPGTWIWLFATVRALTEKIDQWTRWRDDNLPVSSTPSTASDSLPFAAPAGMLAPPPGVARAGRRLKSRFPWVALLFVGAAAAVIFLPQLFGLLLRATGH